MNTMQTPRRLMLGLLSAGLMALLLSCGAEGAAGRQRPGTGSGHRHRAGIGSTPATARGRLRGNRNGTGDRRLPLQRAAPATRRGGNGGDSSTAGNGGTDGSGVGSGGTGVTADAAGIGSADGLGSVILNGLRYDTDSATFTVEDASELQIGMSARIAGKVDANFTSGIATRSCRPPNCAARSRASIRRPAPSS
jgi:hypothetical protein